MRDERAGEKEEADSKCPYRKRCMRLGRGVLQWRAKDKRREKKVCKK